MTVVDRRSGGYAVVTTYTSISTLRERRRITDSVMERYRASGRYFISFPAGTTFVPGAHLFPKDNLPEGWDTTLYTNWVIRVPKVDTSYHKELHHDTIRSELWLLKNQSTLFDTEFGVLQREWHQLTREKVGKTGAPATAIQHNIDSNRADVTALTSRYNELAKRLFPACLAQAIIDGYDLRTGDNLSIDYVVDAADVLGKAVLGTTHPVTRKVAINRWLEQHLRLDANDENYDANGFRITSDAIRLLPKGWKIVTSFSAATSGRATSATRDSALKEILVSEILTKAVNATAPAPSSPPPSS